MLELIDATKHFGDLTAVDRVSFKVDRGETVALLGPSGCGKSTILHLVAGLIELDAGDIKWDGRSVLPVPSHRRGFGLMFQDFALFPHLNVFDNVAFGLRMAGADDAHLQTRCSEVLELVGLAEFGERDPTTLSGGERQRVALARSLAPEPKLLMLDEPLGSLDRTLRERLLRELPRILDQSNQTALYVTHDQEEAFAVGDRVVLLRAGRIEQLGAPLELYRRPASPFAARFFGLTNVLEGHVTVADGGSRVVTKAGIWPIGEPNSATADNQTVAAGRSDLVTILIRPDTVLTVSPVFDDSGQAGVGAVSLDNGRLRLRARVEEVSFRGATVNLTVAVDGHTLSFRLSSRVEVPPVGEAVELGLDPKVTVQLLGS